MFLLTSDVNPDERGANYAVRVPSNDILERDIAQLIPRPVGRPSKKRLVEYKEVRYQAAGWRTARWAAAKVEDHPGELYPRVGFIVTN
jgi:hypothetical protein